MQVLIDLQRRTCAGFGRLRRGKLAARERWPDIGTWLATLRQARSVFHSEADFQQALAWAIHVSDSSARVRLETRPAPGMRLDLLIWRPDLNRHLALELKYLTAAWSGEVDGDSTGWSGREHRTYALTTC